MTAAQSDLSPPQTNPDTIEQRSMAMSTSQLRDEPSDSNPADPEKAELHSSPRPLIIYTRVEILRLHKSPLVKPPKDMPELKDWFGAENEQNLNKKEPETTPPTSTRDRRFRRDPEDGETPARPSFRSTLSQPSQMGNFKHQSLRAPDRDRERDRDRDGERDLRDKEGQERLRNLSDKYDRERLGLPNIRRQERDAAPHLASGASSRLAGQGAASNARRTDTREVGKKKVGEASEDWRREPPRPGRPDKPDNGRRDREERDRPRSRVRDNSRTRQQSSTSPKDRDRDRVRDRDYPDRDRDRRERDRREQDREKYHRDQDRDRHRREERDSVYRDEADHYRRDADPPDEHGDPRHWRDDGKRDERLAATARRGERFADQRDRERTQRDRESAPDSSYDRQRPTADDRDGRSKRNPARDRKPNGAEDGKDRDDRRDRERDKEKEPAWMDTYVPSPTSGSLLGSKAGELDGIQAWKKDMKEKELNEKSFTKVAKDTAATNQTSTSVLPELGDKPLDEIQLFKLLMKKEEEKKLREKAELQTPSSANAETTVQEQNNAMVSTPVHDKLSSQLDVRPSREAERSLPPSNLSAAAGNNPSANDNPHSLLSFLSKPPSMGGSQQPKSSAVADSASDLDKTPTSRLFPNLLSQPSPTKSPLDSASQTHPPQGSRLLALGSRTSAKPQPSAAPSDLSQLPNGLTAQQNPDASRTPMGSIQSGVAPNAFPVTGQTPPKLDPTRTQAGFSPFEEPLNVPLADASELTRGQAQDATRRVSSEHPNLPLIETEPFPEGGLPLDPLTSVALASSKGSRFAKFFDGKARDNVALHRTPVSTGVGPTTPSLQPGQGQRQEPVGLNSAARIGLNNNERRTMEDLFAMLNSSVQNNRINGVNQSMSPLSPGNTPFNQPPQSNLHLLQQQQPHQPQPQHMLPNGRIESLYDSRLDDRSFVPDGLVPGLRSAPPPRAREGGLYADPIDDPIHFPSQRLPTQQHRGLEQGYPMQVPTMFNQQPGRSPGLPMQHPQYRGGPSPINLQNPLQNPPQRLPPGLANLGGRPPHEPSQFIGMANMQSAGLLGALHGHGPQAQHFNNFTGGNLGFNGGPQIRGPAGPPQLQNSMTHNPMASLVHPSNMDMRLQNQVQLMGLGNNGGPLRNGGGFVPQQPPVGQMQPLLGLRQQQQQIQPHMLSHTLPQAVPNHLQQQGLASNNQPTHDLMALLMGGAHRE